MVRFLGEVLRRGGGFFFFLEGLFFLERPFLEGVFVAAVSFCFCLGLAVCDLALSFMIFFTFTTLRTLFFLALTALLCSCLDGLSPYACPDSLSLYAWPDSLSLLICPDSLSLLVCPPLEEPLCAPVLRVPPVRYNSKGDKAPLAPRNSTHCLHS